MSINCGIHYYVGAVIPALYIKHNIMLHIFIFMVISCTKNGIYYNSVSFVYKSVIDNDSKPVQFSEDECDDTDKIPTESVCTFNVNARRTWKIYCFVY